MTAQAKFTMTRQRRMILDELRKTDSHPTADELYRRLRCHLPHISLGTVYRNLGILSDCGLIRKLEVGGGQSRFDGDTGDHYHVRCLGCGRIEDVSPGAVAKIEDDFRERSNYRIVGHRLEFVGFCPECVQAGRGR